VKWEDPDLNELANKAYPGTSSMSRRHFSRSVLPKMFDDVMLEKTQLIVCKFSLLLEYYVNFRKSRDSREKKFPVPFPEFLKFNFPRDGNENFPVPPSPSPGKNSSFFL